MIKKDNFISDENSNHIDKTNKYIFIEGMDRVSERVSKIRDEAIDDNTLFWRKFESLPRDLKRIVAKSWQTNGVPIDVNTDEDIVISVLKKNSEAGFSGFKEDMDKIFEKGHFSEDQLNFQYNIFVAGSDSLKNKLSEEEAKKVKKSFFSRF